MVVDLSPKEGVNAISEVPAAYTTPLFMPLEGQMVSLHQNRTSKGLPKLKHSVEPKQTVHSLLCCICVFGYYPLLFRASYLMLSLASTFCFLDIKSLH